MDFSTYLEQKLSECISEAIATYEGEIKAKDLLEMEQTIRQVTQTQGNEMLRQWLEAQDEKYPADEMDCRCGGKARYQRRRVGVIITLYGRVRYRRSYYLCPCCGKGFYPLDEQLGIRPGQMSDAVIDIAGLLGAQDAFGTSRDVLLRLTGLELSANSIRKACQQIGETVVTEEARLMQQSQALDAQLTRKREAAPTRFYGSMDGFYALFDDGNYHEMKAGAWWTMDADGHTQDIRYYVDTGTAEDFSDLVWATGFELKADQAHELIFIVDGAEWIERIITRHFPQAVQIVDWYHACEYLAPVAQIAFKDETRRKTWIEQTRSDLWHGHIDDVISACRQHVQSHLKPDDDPAQRAIRYFSNNRRRMDYPSYRDKGYQIGSGTMESGCKQIGLGRLKISGARWGKDGARKVAKARAAYLSNQWDHINAQRRTFSQAA